ncbi:recombinase family protein [Sporosalibacterium faouarense]|uniref:recombinase family protein n=1 Tax=Sporosalibacterium faouarense TaxID=516123 RepID=UPI001A9C9B82|nr:recombinase family protein [Sporosalibacterium faouarense]
MGIRNYAYIRVSSKEQNTDRQLAVLKGIDIDERDIYIDKQSGKDFNRPEYQALKRSIRAGDTLFIKSLDRFGRNKKEILREWQWLMDHEINVVVLDMPLLDTRKYTELDGVGELVTNLVLQILSWLAEEERKNIRQRQSEGIKVAKERGVKFGRPKVEIDKNFIETYDIWKKGNITATEAMKLIGMKRNTFYRRVKEHEKQLK